MEALSSTFVYNIFMKPKVKFSQVLKGLIYFFAIPAILLLVGGDINWWQACLYIGISYAAVIVSRVLLAVKHPDLVEERAGFTEKENTKPWDKILAPLVGMWIPLVYYIVAGLDKRFNGSPSLPLWVTIIAVFVSLLGFTLSTWAITTNRFFSAVVRIQTDRDQQVVQSGPYRLMRHPGYAGGLIVALMFPLILNTLWAFIPVGVYMGVLILRTSLEDKTLIKELLGYKEYTEKTRYRLLPGIW